MQRTWAEEEELQLQLQLGGERPEFQSSSLPQMQRTWMAAEMTAEEDEELQLQL